MIINLNNYAEVKITKYGLANMFNYVSRTGIKIEHKYINEDEYVAVCKIQIHHIQEVLGYGYKNEYNMNINVLGE